MRRRIGLALLGAVAATGLAAVLDLGPFRSFEDRLEASVSRSDCASVTRSSHGYYGADYATLQRRASSISSVTCEFLGPDVVWYRFRSAADFRAGVASLRPPADERVCIAQRRREILLGYDAADFQDLCEARGGEAFKGP